MVCGQAALHRADNRNAAADGCLKQIIDVFLCRNLQQLCAVCCHQFLIGRDDIFSRFQAALGKGIGCALAAHGLDDDADLRIIFNDGKILDKSLLMRFVRKIAQIQNIFYFDCLSCIAGNGVRIALKNFKGAGTDGSKTQNCSFQHGFSSLFVIPSPESPYEIHRQWQESQTSSAPPAGSFRRCAPQRLQPPAH